jgi:amino acid adenylation domain-containing protein
VNQLSGATTLFREFFARVQENPAAIAVTDGGEDIAYTALLDHSDRIGEQLSAAGVRPGDRVGICLEKGWRVIASIVAVLSRGCTYVPLDPEYPAARLEFMVSDSGVSTVIGGQGVAGLPESVHRVLPDDCPPQPHHRSRAALATNTAAYIIYTSGSTGTPKGVCVAESGVLELFRSVQDHMEIGSDDVWAWSHSYSFDFSVWEIWGALLFGGRVVVVPKDATRRPTELLETVAAQRVTVLSQVPSSFKYLVKAYSRSHVDLSLRYVIFGGEALDHASVRDWFRLSSGRERLVNMYGITETTVHVTFHEVTPDDVATDSGGTRIGAPLRHLTIALLGPDGQPVPRGEVGEIHVSGSSLALGYHNRPDLTAERFPIRTVDGVAQRWYRSGDLGRQLPDGGFEYLGRVDRQVNLRGFRIELGEVEAAVRGQADVVDAVACVEPVGRGEHLLVVFVVLSDGSTGGAVSEVSARLRDACALVLPAHMVPNRFTVVPEIPLTPSGKLDRGRLASTM